jgi:hypothetical protein
MELENILLVVILCFLILYTITHIKVITPPTPPSPYPYQYPIGGCSGTRYGCCPDNVNAKHDTVGSNCYYHPPLPPNPYPPLPPNPLPPHPLPPNPLPPNPLPPNPNPYPVGGCSGTRYGCCPGNDTAKNDDVGSNCSPYPPPPTPPPQPPTPPTPPPPPPPPPPNNNTCPSSAQGGNCTDTEYSCEELFHGKIYSNYKGCSKGSYCCITPQ